MPPHFLSSPGASSRSLNYQLLNCGSSHWTVDVNGTLFIVSGVSYWMKMTVWSPVGDLSLLTSHTRTHMQPFYGPLGFCPGLPILCHKGWQCTLPKWLGKELLLSEISWLESYSHEYAAEPLYIVWELLGIQWAQFRGWRSLNVVGMSAILAQQHKLTDQFLKLVCPFLSFRVHCVHLCCSGYIACGLPEWFWSIHFTQHFYQRTSDSWTVQCKYRS